VNLFCDAASLMQHATSKKFSGELFDPHYFVSEDEISSQARKGEPNGLESTENRRSVGRNGNQHVYVLDPQVSGRIGN